MRRAHNKFCTCFKSPLYSIKHYFPTLKKFRKLRKKERQKIFHNESHCFIKFIGECCKTVLCDIVKLPNSAYEKLKRHKNIKEDLKYLANESIPIKQKRALLINKGGGFLSIILPVIASTIFGLIGNAALKHFQG